MGENHQSYLIESEMNKGIIFVEEFLKMEWGIEKQGNPDFYFFEFETLSIDEARKIKAIASTKPFGEKKIIIISANFIGGEAQNALLKTFEEPNKDIYFFIIMPNTTSLLPTVKSRLMKISLLDSKRKIDDKAKEFLKGGIDDRLKILSTFLSHESETKKSDLIKFLDNIEFELQNKYLNDTNVQRSLIELGNLKGYLYDRAPSVKMIAEYLALRLPVIK